jgi:hypothetical protein
MRPVKKPPISIVKSSVNKRLKRIRKALSVRNVKNRQTRP